MAIARDTLIKQLLPGLNAAFGGKTDFLQMPNYIYTHDVDKLDIEVCKDLWLIATKGETVTGEQIEDMDEYVREIGMRLHKEKLFLEEHSVDLYMWRYTPSWK